MPPTCFLDHLAITAPSLEAGAEFVFAHLGVMPLPGGEHPRMGTHNLLLRLGENIYLEVIAANPAAPAPAKPRWFGLDNLQADSPASVSAWVARTRNIAASTMAATENLGSVEPMSRGQLNWKITIPVDGMQPLQGIAPALIEWDSDEHPASKMEDKGLSLIGFELHHPEPARVKCMLDSLEFDGPVSILSLPAGYRPFLSARIKTPQGLRRLPALPQI